ncbi:MAG: hypothetical protein ACRD20_18940 [Terriglobales bacterium]
MKQRPLSVTILSWLFIAAGVVALIYHHNDFKVQHPFHYEMLWIALIRLTAIICGVFMLRGRNWARWLTLLWMAYHVVLSAFHSLDELAVHALFLAVFAYILFRPGAIGYFRGTGVEAR